MDQKLVKTYGFSCLFAPTLEKPKENQCFGPCGKPPAPLGPHGTPGGSPGLPGGPPGNPHWPQRTPGARKYIYKLLINRPKWRRLVYLFISRVLEVLFECFLGPGGIPEASRARGNHPVQIWAQTEPYGAVPVNCCVFCLLSEHFTVFWLYFGAKKFAVVTPESFNLREFACELTSS